MNTNNVNYIINRDARLTNFPLKISIVISNFSDEINEFNSESEIISLFGINNPANTFEFEFNHEIVELFKSSKLENIDSARLVYEIGYVCVAYQTYLDLLRLKNLDPTARIAESVNEQIGFSNFFSEHFMKSINYDDFEYYSETGNSEVLDWLTESITNCQPE